MAATLAANQGFFHENSRKHEKTWILSKAHHFSLRPQQESFSVCQSVSVYLSVCLSLFLSVYLSHPAYQPNGKIIIIDRENSCFVIQ